MGSEPAPQAAVLAGLWGAARAGRLPHALLFTGPDGIGKWSAARRFARGLLCAAGPGEPCDRCGPCKRVLSGGGEEGRPGAGSGSHPDLLVLDPLESGLEQIPIDWFAERDKSPPERVDSFLALKAAAGGWRAVLLREAERMNEVAQNALLKTLEEPAPGDLLVLVTARPDRLLGTVQSRCSAVRFEPPGAATALAVLREAGAEAELAQRLARWAGGSPGRALELHRRGAAEMVAIATELLAGRAPPLASARALWALEHEFPGKTPRAQARERARTAIELLAGIAGDALRLSLGAAAGSAPDARAELSFGEVLAPLAGLPLAASPALAARVLEDLARARQDIEQNLAPDAAVERAFLALGDGALPRRAAARAGSAGAAARGEEQAWKTGSASSR